MISVQSQHNRTGWYTGWTIVYSELRCGDGAAKRNAQSNVEEKLQIQPGTGRTRRSRSGAVYISSKVKLFQEDALYFDLADNVRNHVWHSTYAEMNVVIVMICVLLSSFISSRAGKKFVNMCTRSLEMFH